MQTRHLAVLVITITVFLLPKQLIYLMFVYISIFWLLGGLVRLYCFYVVSSETSDILGRL